MWGVAVPGGVRPVPCFLGRVRLVAFSFSSPVASENAHSRNQPERTLPSAVLESSGASALGLCEIAIVW